MLDKEQRALIAVADCKEIFILPKMANRHGLITGATGTGKTVTLQTLAETFSQMGVPVFAADVKGDLSGIAAIGGNKKSIMQRAEDYKLADKGFSTQSFPVEFWDVFGESGIPVRASVQDMGPLLFGRLLNLNDTQSAVLTVVFKIAADENLELIDLKDLRRVLQYAAYNAKEFLPTYGNLSSASIGAIQRSLIALEHDGADAFFGEPRLNINDIVQACMGKGVINILAADKLMNSPQTYSVFLLWMLDKLFDVLPESGDPEKPVLVFFFDEAHLLFNDAPKALLEKIEQVVRLIRSKGVGIYFVSQSPSDLPDSVLGQLGNRVQHALRAYTPKDQKALKAAAASFRPNPAFETEAVIAELGIGEALISFLDAKGAPQPVERAFIVPPQSQIGPLADDVRTAMLQKSVLKRLYGTEEDRRTAYEILNDRQADAETAKARAERKIAEEKERKEAEKVAEAQRKIEEKARLAQEKAERKQAAEQRKFWGKFAQTVARGVLGNLFKRR